MSYPLDRPTPTEVREGVSCPYCLVRVGQFCMGVRKQRKANHLERVRAYTDRMLVRAIEGR